MHFTALFRQGTIPVLAVQPLELRDCSKEGQDGGHKGLCEGNAARRSHTLLYPQSPVILPLSVHLLYNHWWDLNCECPCPKSSEL